ncbi:MAG: hypothetical protein LH615_00595 [Ferruginibacter sp.]|nr:hypothetical protein [Ferruginibacter sp.]
MGTVIGTISYQAIGAKNLPFTNSSLTQIKLGYKTGFLNSGFFAAADAGVSGYYKGLNDFVVGVAVGHSFKVSPSSYIDLFPAFSIMPDSWGNNLWLTANALFRFNLQKKK